MSKRRNTIINMSLNIHKNEYMCDEYNYDFKNGCKYVSMITSVNMSISMNYENKYGYNYKYDYKYKV